MLALLNGPIADGWSGSSDRKAQTGFSATAWGC